MIRLGKITEDNYKECLELKVAENQTDFVSSNTLSLAKAFVFRDTVTPFAIYEDKMMVGFIMLRFNEEINNYFIWQFMIDERYQGKGYGKEAMNQAIEWMKKDKRCTNISLTYTVGNEGAKKLYNQLGFEYMSELEGIEVDMVMRF